MHEEALVRDLGRKLAELSREHDGARIVRVRVALGVVSHLDERRLRELWPSRFADGPASGASLEVETLGDPADPRAASLLLRSVTFDDGVPADRFSEGSSPPRE
jgi:hypothetical protein